MLDLNILFVYYIAKKNDGNLSLILEMNVTVVVYIGHVTHYVTVCRYSCADRIFWLDRMRYELLIREALHCI